MIDIAAIGSVLSRATGTGWEAAYRQDVGALLDALEAANAEAATMRAWAEEAARAENENADDAQKERAAVVAWLKKQRIYCTDSTGEPNAVTATYAHAAEAVERGEHCREGEP